MNRRELLLLVLAAARGQPYEPVQVQKATFLITENLGHLITDGRGFDFQPYDYGPFDKDVYSEANRLCADNLAVISPSQWGRWRTYAASEHGVRDGEALFQRLTPIEIEYIEAVSKWIRKQSFGSLLKSIYEAYPAMKINSVFEG